MFLINIFYVVIIGVIGAFFLSIVTLITINEIKNKINI